MVPNLDDTFRRPETDDSTGWIILVWGILQKRTASKSGTRKLAWHPPASCPCHGPRLPSSDWLSNLDVSVGVAKCLLSCRKLTFAVFLRMPESSCWKALQSLPPSKKRRGRGGHQLANISIPVEACLRGWQDLHHSGTGHASN